MTMAAELERIGPPIYIRTRAFGEKLYAETLAAETEPKRETSYIRRSPYARYDVHDNIILTRRTGEQVRFDPLESFEVTLTHLDCAGTPLDLYEAVSEHLERALELNGVM